MTHQLLNQTLPTVIGAGVVTRATDTVFGKRSRSGKGGTTRKVKSRRFDGKVYGAANWHGRKGVAEKDARYFRSRGHSARIIKEYNSRLKRWGYMVYVR